MTGEIIANIFANRFIGLGVLLCKVLDSSSNPDVDNKNLFY